MKNAKLTKKVLVAKTRKLVALISDYIGGMDLDSEGEGVCIDCRKPLPDVDEPVCSNPKCRHKKLRDMIKEVENLLPKKEFTVEDWLERYTPVENPNASLGWVLAGKHHIFNTMGADLDFVQRQQQGKVWTLVDEEGEQFLLAGFHIVNRLGYVVSTNMWSNPNEVYLFK